jgi:hypothetical protein
MNQDVYIFERMNLQGVAISEHLEVGIERCNIHVVEKLWSKMLERTHSEEYKDNPPEFSKWHKHFEPVVEDIAAHGYKLFLFGRHALTEEGFLYPKEDEIDKQKFINSLPTPVGTKSYDDIFNYAVNKVATLWQHISAGVFLNSTNYQTAFRNWNLDKGITQQDWELSGHGKYIFWEGSL